MFQRRDQKAERENFWQKTEEELGESIRAFALTRCLRGCAPGDAALWGVLFLTESSLYFRHFEQQNWFSALTSAMSSERRESEEVYFGIARDRITSVELQKPGSRLSRLFSYRPPVLHITHTHGSGAAVELRFTLDTNSDEIYRELSISD